MEANEDRNVMRWGLQGLCNPGENVVGAGVDEEKIVYYYSGSWDTNRRRHAPARTKRGGYAPGRTNRGVDEPGRTDRKRNEHPARIAGRRPAGLGRHQWSCGTPAPVPVRGTRTGGTNLERKLQTCGIKKGCVILRKTNVRKGLVD